MHSKPSIQFNYSRTSRAQRGRMDKKGIRIGSRYPRLLLAFAAWGAIGGAFLLIVTTQAICGIVLMSGGIAAVVLAIDGRYVKERVYSRLDLATQWIVLPLPLITLAVLIIVLGGSVLGPYLAFALVYWIVLAAILVAAALELRRGERVR